MKICIVGAGVTGLTSAWYLSSYGHDVTLIDAAAGPGSGASFANGAQLSYSYVAPLADGSVWKNIPKYLFSKQSPLSFKFELDPHQWKWLIQFLLACRSEEALRTTRELLRLAFYSKDCLGRLQSELDLQFDHRIAGKLVLYGSEDSLVSARRQVVMQSGWGCEQAVLTAKQCIEIEPALAHSEARWAGAVYTPSEEVGDCAKFCVELGNALRHRYPTSRFYYGTRVEKVVVENGRAITIETSNGNFNFDILVNCAGAGGGWLAHLSGFSIPVYPLKGYSITASIANQSVAPSMSITDLPNKVVYARVGDRLRVAGRVEIVGNDNSIDLKKCEHLKKSVDALFPGSIEVQNIIPWAGQRPATPKGMPLIGRSPVSNLYLNTGHGALGWTLACGSARLLADQIEGRQPEIDDRAFQSLHT